MKVLPFRPLIPRDNAEANRLSCPPYDVLSTSEARSYLEKRPLSFMSVIRPEANLSEDTPAYDNSVYESAKESLETLESSGRLVRVKDSTLYIYELQWDTHVQRGIVCLCSAEDYDKGVIVRHERTRPEKEDDRTRLTDVLSANTGPVFLTYRDESSIDDIVNRYAFMRDGKLFYVSKGDVLHSFWQVSESDAAELTRLFSSVKQAYIADGHHRAASAARVARRRSEASGFLSVLFPSSQLEILPYHRLVTDMNDLTAEEFETRLEQHGELRRVESVRDDMMRNGVVYMFMGEQWYEYCLDRSGRSGVDRLDCAVLQETVLGEILGIRDVRTSKRIEFAGGIRGVGYLERRVRSGDMALAFAMCAVSIDEVMQVGDKGEIMPPKSTWFEPKLVSGIFVHKF